MKRVVELSPRALRHVADMFAYIAERSGTERAQLVTGRLLAACASLSDMPERGTMRDDLMPGLRTMGYKRQATVAFVIEPDRILVLAVLGRGRDLERVLGDDA